MQPNVLNVTAYNWPMREHVQNFVMGPYRYMHLLQRLGPRCFFRGIRLYCGWVLPTTMTMYATWALRRALTSCTTAIREAKIERSRHTEPHHHLLFVFLIFLRIARLRHRRRRRGLCTGCCIPFPRLFGPGSSIGLVEGIRKRPWGGR